MPMVSEVSILGSASKETNSNQYQEPNSYNPANYLSDANQNCRFQLFCCFWGANIEAKDDREC